MVCAYIYLYGYNTDFTNRSEAAAHAATSGLMSVACELLTQHRLLVSLCELVISFHSEYACIGKRFTFSSSCIYVIFDQQMM